MDNLDFIDKFVNAKELYKKHGNLKAEGKRLYSYETCIAEKEKDTNGADIMLVSNNTFSMTTARHLYILRSKCAQAGILTVKLPQYYNSEDFYGIHIINKIKDTLTWCYNDGVSRKNVRETIIDNYEMLKSTLMLAKFNRVNYAGVNYNTYVNELLDQYRDLYNNAKEKERARIEKLRAKYN